MSTTFNEPAARNILKHLGKVNGAWDQGVWRTFDADYIEPVEALDPANFDCKTSMCTAGWDVQLHGKYALTAGIYLALSKELSDLNKYVLGGIRADLVTYVVVEEDKLLKFRSLGRRVDRALSVYNDRTLDKDRIHKIFAQEHGEGWRDLRTMEIADWSALHLGIGDDPMHLFGSGHDLDDLERIVDHYAEHGTSQEAACEFGWLGPCEDCSYCRAQDAPADV